MSDPDKSAYDFWEDVYKKKTTDSSGKPSAILEKYIRGRPVGVALDLGCARGDDAVWLARQNWQVTAVDVSATALRYAQENAVKNGVTDQVIFEQRDLAVSFPDIQCDLVSAMFLQTPIAFPRADVLGRAAASLRSGGLLLVATHGSVMPWSQMDPDTILPTAREILDELNLMPTEWAEIFVGSSERNATGPNGETALVTDAIIAIERR